jgi:two-component system phosphate regulon sensor histidine kinase PhoR
MISATTFLLMMLSTMTASWLGLHWIAELLLDMMILLVGIVAITIVTRQTTQRIEQALRTIVETSEAICNGATAARIPIESTYDGKGGLGDLPVIRTVYQAVNRLADKQAQDLNEMKRLERVRSEFLANVSHELRTPIFSIQGFLETLLDGALDDESVRQQFVERAHSNTVRLNVLLTDLIDISRIESGAMKFSFRYFPIVPLLEEVTRTLEPAASANNIGLTIRTDRLKYGTETTVYGDRDRIAQVLMNLMDNAIKYNVPHGSVLLCAESVSNGSNAPGHIRISVRDTGIGIAPEHHARIFERFYRVDKGRSRAVGGTGLGLAIVKHIIEAHKSAIAIESAPNQGTTVSFTLKQ